MSDVPLLAEPEWLAAHLDDPQIRILDVSYFVPGGIDPARKQYEGGHIPGAIFFDINDVAETAASKEHAFPKPETFAQKIGTLGIDNATHVVAYDHLGGACAAARAWFMFRAFGHHRVSILDGGRTQWMAENRPLVKEMPENAARTFRVSATPFLKTKADMRANIDEQAFQVLDARSKGRFEGTEPEPRAGLRSGHIPGSLNLPFLHLIETDTKRWKAPAAIKALFEAADIDLSRPLATTCGSGVSACALAFGAALIGKEDVALYDGSWVDWGRDQDLPVVTGAATATKP